METIIADAMRRLHEISIHAGAGDFEQDVAALYAVQDVMEDVETAALVLGVAL